MAGSDDRLLLLNESDNVFVARRRIPAGERIAVMGTEVTLTGDLPLGHKLARRAIPTGHKIIKYAVPIGSATFDIALGQHVHVHNVKSDYTPTYHLTDAPHRGEGDR
ncbi:hydrolase [Skermanella stibiiresistens SB22]|uniref:Hydrolase n=1 Tax=Skermanella stibiiresistens SB22 TaxID=1385369 RepID=W9HAB0_9PROT|nr:UxaA family hydrolase [Skermanella stibiiresistens]EWY41671.1 hydrolase [Skermanella stibiiresistens SB22]